MAAEDEGEAEEYLKFLLGQHLFRPQHPDFETLRKIVARNEELKDLGVSASTAFDDIADIPSVAYLAAQRCAMTLQTRIEKGEAPRLLAREMQQFMIDMGSNAWVEGFLFGVLFERLRTTGSMDRQPEN